MDAFTVIAPETELRDSLTLLMDNDNTALSQSAGTVFPTENLYVGRPCMRTDTGVLYVCTALGPPVVWSLVIDFNKTPLHEEDADLIYLAIADATAENISYSNATSGLDAIEVQTAIDELAPALKSLRQIGSWNAATDTPTMASATTGNQGHFYLVSVAGTTVVDGIDDWRVGDWIISTGSAWIHLKRNDTWYEAPDAAILKSDATATLTAGFGAVKATLIYGVNVTVNLASAQAFDLTATGNFQLDNPTEPPGATAGTWYVDVTASGADRTVTLDTEYTLQSGSLVVTNGTTKRFWIVAKSASAYHVYVEALS